MDLSRRPGCGSPAVALWGVGGQNDNKGQNAALQTSCLSLFLPSLRAQQGPSLASPSISRPSFPRPSTLPVAFPLVLVNLGWRWSTDPLPGREQSLPRFPQSLHCAWCLCRTGNPVAALFSVAFIEHCAIRVPRTISFRFSQPPCEGGAAVNPLDR